MKRILNNSPSGSQFYPKKMSPIENPILLLAKQLTISTESITTLASNASLDATTVAALNGISLVLATCQTVLMDIANKPNARTADDMERERSVVITGMPESRANNSVAAYDDDMNNVCTLLGEMQVQCRPICVYRMGKKENRTSPRPMKCVFPAKTFAWQTLGGWKRCRDRLKTDEFWKKTWIRPSLSQEQLKSEYEERMKKRNAMNTGGTLNNPAGPFPSTVSMINPPNI